MAGFDIILTNVQGLKHILQSEASESIMSAKHPPLSYKKKHYYFNFNFFVGCPFVSASFLFFDLEMVHSS
jgi:hypothetical protein